ncbi:hypothetical protein [Aeromonas hydrophila]|uniref:hypothetical protein n=1 Tax=Aeromonas hydrophila TaxID=644 RepID=UPI001C9E004E|nr:hypothetical protein [Aeromonas hydrophila]
MPYSKIAFSLIAILAGALHTFGFLKFDAIGMTLLMLATIPWASSWLESIKFGNFEAKFRELKEAVDATQKELDQLKSTYLEMEKDFLKTCAEFSPDASAAELNKLASRLKAKAKGLTSIDFLFSNLAETSNQAEVFGAACALHVRPQFHAIDGVISLIDALSKTADLRGFRLKTIYRLLMAVDEIVKLDTRNDDGLLTDEQRKGIARALEQLQSHQRCITDDTSQYAAKIVAKL